MHSSTFNVTSADLTVHIQDMVDLLQEPVVSTYLCASNAIRDLRQVYIHFYACN